MSLNALEAGYVYNVSEEEIKNGVKEGCRWCDLLNRWGSSRMNIISQSPVSPAQNIVEIKVGYSDYEKTCIDITVNGSLCWFGYVYTMEGAYPSDLYETCLILPLYVPADPAAAYVSGRNLFCDIGSDRALSLAMDMLHNCSVNHSRCPSIAEPHSQLPSRVIDCSNPSQPNLFITSGLHARYIALSYVWGEAQEHKTTTKNIDSYIRSISIDILPRTIVDAILITHRLGVRYLWVDSLCIIQDSDDDKDRELAYMRHIYADAYLTIIAASASRVSEGFLQPRIDKFGAAAIELPFILPNDSLTRSLGKIFLSSWLITTPKYDPAREPLHTRGWCMQEYFLSPRKLIFATHTLQYACLSGGTHNIGGAGNPWWISSVSDPTPFRDLPRISLSHSQQDNLEQVETLRKAWKATIENYTKRGVSVPSDKLVAISSLAEEFSHVSESPYLAGLWKRTLLTDLLWHKDRAVHFTPRPTVYRAPSWSWAALDGPVSGGNAYLSNVDQVIAQVVRCETVLKKQDLPFGEVTAGILVLRARVVNCVVLPHWAVYCPRDLTSMGQIPLPKAERPPQFTVGDPLVDKQRMQEIGLCHLDSDDDGIRSGIKQGYVVPLYTRAPSAVDERGAIQGLVVERLDSESAPYISETEAKYRRIAMFEGTLDASDWLENAPERDITIV